MQEIGGEEVVVNIVSVAEGYLFNVSLTNSLSERNSWVCSATETN